MTQPDQNRSFNPFPVPNLNWSFLDLIVLAYWQRVKQADRRESLLYEITCGIAEISEEEAYFVGGIKIDEDESKNTGFAHYVGARCFFGLKIGPLTNEELLAMNGNAGCVRSFKQPLDPILNWQK